MTNDNGTLMDTINFIADSTRRDPHWLTPHDIDDFERLQRDTKWLISESYRGPMNSAHHDVFDRVCTRSI